MSIEVDFIVKLGTSFAKGLFGKAGQEALAPVLNALGLGNDLAEKQLDEMKELNKSMKELGRKLDKIDNTLKDVEATLGEVLNEEVFRSWQLEADSLSHALTRIDVDFDDLMNYSTPTADGKLPAVSKDSMEAFKNQAYLAPSGTTSKMALQHIHLAITAKENGILLLLAKHLGKSAHVGKKLDAHWINDAANTLFNYYLRLASRQLKAVQIVIAARGNAGDDRNILTNEWRSYTQMISQQEEHLCDALSVLVSAVSQIGGFTIITGADSHCMDAQHETGRSLSNDMYTAVKNCPYLNALEELLAAFAVVEPGEKRVVIQTVFRHTLAVADMVASQLQEPIALSGVPDGIEDTPEVRECCATYVDHVSKKYCKWYLLRSIHKLEGVHQELVCRMDVTHNHHDPLYADYYHVGTGKTYPRTMTCFDDHAASLELRLPDDARVGVLRFVPYTKSIE